MNMFNESNTSTIDHSDAFGVQGVLNALPPSWVADADLDTEPARDPRLTVSLLITTTGIRFVDPPALSGPSTANPCTNRRTLRTIARRMRLPAIWRALGPGTTARQVAERYHEQYGEVISQSVAKRNRPADIPACKVGLNLKYQTEEYRRQCETRQAPARRVFQRLVTDEVRRDIEAVWRETPDQTTRSIQDRLRVERGIKLSVYAILLYRPADLPPMPMGTRISPAAGLVAKLWADDPFATYATIRARATEQSGTLVGWNAVKKYRPSPLVRLSSSKELRLERDRSAQVGQTKLTDNSPADDATDTASPSAWVADDTTPDATDAVPPDALAPPAPSIVSLMRDIALASPAPGRSESWRRYTSGPGPLPGEPSLEEVWANAAAIRTERLLMLRDDSPERSPKTRRKWKAK